VLFTKNAVSPTAVLKGLCSKSPGQVKRRPGLLAQHHPLFCSFPFRRDSTRRKGKEQRVKVGWRFTQSRAVDDPTLG